MSFHGVRWSFQRNGVRRVFFRKYFKFIKRLTMSGGSGTVRGPGRVEFFSDGFSCKKGRGKGRFATALSGGGNFRKKLRLRNYTLRYFKSAGKTFGTYFNDRLIDFSALRICVQSRENMHNGTSIGRASSTSRHV